MGRTAKGVELTIGILLAGGGTLTDAAYHVAVASREPWFFFAWLCFIFAVVLALSYFGLHPLFVRLDHWRVETLTRYTVARVGPTRRLRRDDRRKLEIIDAQYVAVGEPRTTKDVTAVLQGALVDNHLSVPVTNVRLGVDPLLGHPKVLNVRYRFKGKERLKVFQENETAILP